MARITAVIRNAGPDDASWFVAHVRELASDPGRQIPLEPEEWTVTAEQQIEQFTSAINGNGDLYLIAEVNGERIGKINLKRGTRKAFRRSATLGMSVKASWRGQGVGRLLLERAVRWAEGADIRRIELYVFPSNVSAIHLYGSIGFVVEARRSAAIFRDGQLEDDLLMALIVSRKEPNRSMDRMPASVTTAPVQPARQP
jgi:RimJ/RimL family protein N-acetyltransferase